MVEFSSKRKVDSGFVLVGTLVFLVLVELMVSGIFLLGLFELRQGRSTMLLEHAFRSSEEGAAIVVGALQSGRAGEVGDRSLAKSGTSGSGSYEAVQISFGSSHSLIRSVGLSREGFAMQEIGILLEHILPQLGGTVAALNVLGSLEVGPGLLVSGFDVAQSSAPGCMDPEDTGGLNIVLASGDDPAIMCAGCFEGSPPVLVDSTVGDSSRFGSYSLLRSQADKRFAGGTVGLIGPRYLSDGKCDTEDPVNWGDSRSAGGPCGSYRPVIYSQSDLKIVGGSGQGVLLVDGDLELTGGFEFSGVVVVKGDLTIGDTGANVLGVVTAETVFFPQNPSVSGPFFSFSSCAVNMALEAHLIPMPLKERSWVALY